MKVELRACLWRGSLLTTLPSVVWFSSCLFLAPLSTAMRYNSISPNPITAPTTIKKCNKRRIFLLDTHHQAVPPLTCCKYSRRKKWTSYGKKSQQSRHNFLAQTLLYPHFNIQTLCLPRKVAYKLLNVRQYWKVLFVYLCAETSDFAKRCLNLNPTLPES